MSRSLIVGFTWYCQIPGVHWATDPSIGWSLFNTDGGWHLMGHGLERPLHTDLLKVAMRRVAADLRREER